MFGKETDWIMTKTIRTIRVDELRSFAAAFVAQEPGLLGTEAWWQTPLLATAPVDSRFDQLPQIAADDHVLPRDLLASARSVIVFYVPFKKDLVKGNRKGDRPSRNWGLAYVQTNDLIGWPTQSLGDLLAEKGFKSGPTPATHNFADLPESTHAFGKCAALMPCSYKNPVAVMDADKSS